MKVPLSWLKDYVDITITPEALAHRLTFAGLEVEEMLWVGLAPTTANIDGLPDNPDYNGPRATGLAWDPEKIVVADLWEVGPHPNADRLTLCEVDDGQQTHTVLTGAPNLFVYKGQGRLDSPLKIAYAREGAMLYDGHADELTLMTLKRSKIRGVESYSMACSERELGISDEHEGIMLLPADAPAAGTPLANYLGDVVLDVKINPNMARNTGIVGIAREVAAITGADFHPPAWEAQRDGPPIDGAAAIEIRVPELNPRFTLTLIEGITPGPSPFWMQRRLRLAGMRPISNVVDVTNYVMLETGQPLHAFDYDVLCERAGGKAPTIITRLPEPGERLTTLDDVDRKLDDYTILVTDTAGALSLGGIMGGEESEVNPGTTRVLLESASWNFINVRRSVTSQQLQTSQAGYRFSRGVHPSMAEHGNWRGAELMRLYCGGTVRQGMVDDYPLPYPDVTVDVPLNRVAQLLGVNIPKARIIEILESLEFTVEDAGEVLRVTQPDFRMDIGEGVIGLADIAEEIARIYGYENIPETQIDDEIPQQRNNPSLEYEERVRDLLVTTGLQEVITYRMTSPEREARIFPPGVEGDTRSYVALANPIAAERTVMRHSVLASIMEIAEHNRRFVDRLALFEIGAVYIPVEGERLPAEPVQLAIVMSGPRENPGWMGTDTSALDFYDLKGVVDAMLGGLHVQRYTIEAGSHRSLRPGRTALVMLDGRQVGAFGELHPLVREQYRLSPDYPVLAAEFDLALLMAGIPADFVTAPVSRYPAIVEDIALVVDASLPATEVAALIEQTGGELLTRVELFDMYEGEQIAAGKKSLAYRLTYQADDRTLTDKDAAKLRQKIVKRLSKTIGAELRA